MPAIQCKPCGKKWDSVQGYMKEHGCEKCDCPHNKQRPVLNTSKSDQREARIDRTEGTVPSEIVDQKQPQFFLDVPNIISLEIYPPGCRAKRKKGAE